MKCDAVLPIAGHEVACELEEGHAGDHNSRSFYWAPRAAVSPEAKLIIERIANCPKCGALACLHKTISGLHLTPDRAAGVVRFSLLIPDGRTMCGAIPAVEAADLAAELARVSKEAMR